NCETLVRRLQAVGYDGKTTLVKDFVRPLRPRAAGHQPVLRYETTPGEPVQFDWGECVFEREGVTRKLVGFTAGGPELLAHALRGLREALRRGEPRALSAGGARLLWRAAAGGADRPDEDGAAGDGEWCAAQASALRVRALVDVAVRLIPVFAHRYMLAQP